MSSRWSWLYMALAGLAWVAPAAAQYGSIKGLPIARPEDVQNVESAPPPPGAVVLFDGTGLDNWTKRDSKDKPGWKLLPGGIGEAHGGDIMTKQEFGGHFK